jgi:hypothetical protein
VSTRTLARQVYNNADKERNCVPQHQNKKNKKNKNKNKNKNRKNKKNKNKKKKKKKKKFGHSALTHPPTRLL